MRPLLLALLFGALVACGTGQVKVEQHLECNTDGTECQTVQVSKQEPSFGDYVWQFLLLLAVANSGH